MNPIHTYQPDILSYGSNKGVVSSPDGFRISDCAVATYVGMYLIYIVLVLHKQNCKDHINSDALGAAYLGVESSYEIIRFS